MANTLATPTSVLLPNEAIEEIREIAAEEDRSISSLISEIVIDFLKSRKKAFEPDEQTWKNIEQAREDMRNGKCKTFSSANDAISDMNNL